MKPEIQLKQYNRVKEDWGFFVPIDLESELTNKPVTSSVIIISEKEKIKYYLKLHQQSIARSVVVLKNAHGDFSPRKLNNNYLKESINNNSIDNDIPNHKKTFQRAYVLLTTILSSGLFLFFCGHSMFKFK